MSKISAITTLPYKYLLPSIKSLPTRLISRLIYVVKQGKLFILLSLSYPITTNVEAVTQIILSDKAKLAPPQVTKPSRASTSVYQSKDKQGTLIFSDKKPKHNSYIDRTLPQLVTTQWNTNKLPSIQLSSQNNKIKKPSHRDTIAMRIKLRQKHCLKSLKQIVKLESALNKAQKIRVFDQYKQQLSQLRWYQRKNCQ
jgi:hypothetical protein